MNGFWFTDEQEAIREGVLKLCARFDADYWRRTDETGDFPEDFVSAMAGAGWLGAAMPVELGGSGLGVTEAAIAMQAVAESGAGFSGASALHLNIFGPMPLVKFGTDVADRIVQRGGAQPGDKTVLDVILPSLATLDESDGLTPVDTLTRVINSVRSAIDASTPLRSARGRAAWLQERSIGQQDPGMTAYLGFLEELRAAVENTDAANGGVS